MAGMQVYSNFQASPTGAPGQPFQASGAPSGAELAARQMQDAGAAVQKAGDVGSRIALSMQEQVNQVRVNDALNKARQAAQDLAYHPETGYLNLKGDAALTRPGGQALPDEFGDKLKTQISAIAGGLSNAEQQRVFSAAANDLGTQFRGQVETHMLGEFRAHADSVQNGTIDLAANDAKLNWSNPDKIFGTSVNGQRQPGTIDAIKAAVVEKGRISGWSASQTGYAMEVAVSHTHAGVVEAALANNNAAYALSYLDRARKAGEMTADDILKLQGRVNENVWLGQAQGAVQAATAAVRPLIAPTPTDRLLAITLGAESGGRDTTPDGKPLLGPVNYTGERAMFGMQVMPATAKNPGHGIAPVAAQTAAEFNRVGAELMHALVQKYGDPGKAWAAYNWGEGNLDKALKQVDAERGQLRGAMPDDYWMGKLPPETQKYVTKNVAALARGAGVAPAPTELDFLNTALAQLPPGAPAQVIQKTREQAIQQFGVISKTLKEQGQNSLAQAQRWLAENDGNIGAMPAPLRDAVIQNAPGDMHNLASYAKSISKGDTTTDLVLYNRLAAHPDEMAGMTDPQFEMLKAHLAPADFKHFANERSNYLNGKTDESAGAINTTALKASLNPRLAALGINAAPNPKDIAAQQRVGGIRLFVRDSLFAAQQQAGKKFTADEVEQHIDGLFMRSVEFKNSLWGSTSTENLMGMQPKDLPAGAYEGIKKALVDSGRKAPTDNDIMNLYRKLHASK